MTLALDRLGWDRGAGNMVAGLGVALCGLTAFAHTAKLVTGGVWQWHGVRMVIATLMIIPGLLWSVLKRWPDGKLAALTNAADAGRPL